MKNRKRFHLFFVLLMILSLFSPIASAETTVQSGQAKFNELPKAVKEKFAERLPAVFQEKLLGTEVAEEGVITNIKVTTDQGNIPSGNFDFVISGNNEENVHVFYYGYLNEQGLFVDYELETKDIVLPVGTYQLRTYNYQTGEELVTEFAVDSGVDYVSTPIDIVLDDEFFQFKSILYVQGTTEASITVYWEPKDFDLVEKINLYLNDKLIDEITDIYTDRYTFTDLKQETSYSVKVQIVYTDGLTEVLTAEVETTAPPTGDVVVFKDENLKLAVQDNLGIYHRAVYTDDMEKLTTLDAPYYGIKDLTGLEYATNVENLALFGNEIEDVSPLANLSNLLMLDLDENLISKIEDFGDLVKLEALLLSYNQLEDISFLKDLPSLQFVTLIGNEGLDFSKGSKDYEVVKSLMYAGVHVDWVYLQNGIFITDLTEASVTFDLYFEEIAELVSTYRIYLNGKLVDEVPSTQTNYELTGLDPLTEYDIYIEAVDEEGLVWGTVYDFIQTLPNPEGQVIHFADENLELAVRDALYLYSRELYESDLLVLTSLYAMELGITDLSGLEFATNLEELYLDGNLIESIEPLSGLTKLYSLTLGNNLISDISPLSNLTNLEALSLNHNLITDISPLVSLKQVQLLDLSGNEIEELSVLLELDSLFIVILLETILDLTPGSDDMILLNQLREKGVYVLYENLDIIVENVTETSIELSWNPLIESDEEFVYDIYLNEEEFLEEQYADNHYVLEGLDPNTEYRFDILGYNSTDDIAIGTVVVTTASEEEENPGEEPGEGPGEEPGNEPGNGDNDGNNPVNPGDNEEDDSNTDGKSNDKGNTNDKGVILPDTATNNYNLLFVGTSLLLLGAMFVMFSKRKRA